MIANLSNINLTVATENKNNTGSNCYVSTVALIWSLYLINILVPFFTRFFHKKFPKCCLLFFWQTWNQNFNTKHNYLVTIETTNRDFSNKKLFLLVGLLKFPKNFPCNCCFGWKSWMKNSLLRITKILGFTPEITMRVCYKKNCSSPLLWFEFLKQFYCDCYLEKSYWK